jgi:hypothetical protein
MNWSVLLAVLLAAPALAAPRVIPASDLLIRQSSPEIGWRWRVAPEAATAPALLASMRGAALKAAAKAKTDATKDAVEAKQQGYPFRRYESIADWTLAADTPRLLALAGESYSFTGGAHGNTGFTARIWDKTAKRSIAFDALFTDWPRARKLLEPAFCKALADEQTRRLGAKPADDMHACPKLGEQPVVPFAGLAPLATQFRVLVAPYVAGAYAEGSYLITVPWPEAVKPLVKPAYRGDLLGE